MHIVITGATGTVGRALVDALGKEPSVRSIIAIARHVPDREAKKTYFVDADVAEEPLAPLFEGADAVVHLAWQFEPERRPDEMWSTNVLGSRRVFDAVRQAGVPRLIHASSFAAYASRENALPVDESFPLTGVPSSLYSKHKVEVERRLDEFEARNPGIGVVRVRPCLTLERGAASEVVRRLAGSVFPETALGSVARQIGRYLAQAGLQAVLARDVAEAYRLVLVRNVHGAFNIAPRGHRVAQEAPETSANSAMMMKAAAVAFRLRLHRIHPGVLDAAMRAPLLDDGRAQRVLGYGARFTTEQAIARAIWDAQEKAPAAGAEGRQRHTAQKTNTAHVSAQYPAM